MSERPMSTLAALDDAGLEAVLRDLATAIEWPTAAPMSAPDVATRVRVRLGERPTRARRWLATPWRRAVLLALVALLALAAIAGAVGLGLPGLRLTLAEPSSPPPTVDPARTAAPGPPGARLGLGDHVSLAEASASAPGRILLPTDPALGPPDAVYVDPRKGDQIALVWGSGPDLPELLEPGVGMILMSFDGTVGPEFREKIIGGDATMEPVRVGTADGLWIEGDPHIFFYRGEGGEFIDDERRWVGDALLWSDDGTTYRLETSLGRDAAIALAESLE